MPSFMIGNGALKSSKRQTRYKSRSSYSSASSSTTSSASSFSASFSLSKASQGLQHVARSKTFRVVGTLLLFFCFVSFSFTLVAWIFSSQREDTGQKGKEKASKKTQRRIDRRSRQRLLGKAARKQQMGLSTREDFGKPELIRSQPGGNVHSSSKSPRTSDLMRAKGSSVNLGRKGSSGSAAVCSRCQRPSTLRCSQCKAVRYCTKQCQELDWKAGHNTVCKTLALSPACSPISGNSPSKRDVRSNALTASNDENILVKPARVLYPFESFLELYDDLALDSDVSDGEEDQGTSTSTRTRVVEEISKDSYSYLSAPVGLRNVGNSCFANSVIQSLLHTEPFANYFLKSRYGDKWKNEEDEAEEGDEWDPLFETESLVQNYYHNEKRVFSPRNFLINIEEIGRHFCFGDQEDAHDFLVEWLDSIQTRLVKESTKSSEEGEGEKLDQRSEETSLIWQIFGGYTRGEVNCECGYTSKTFQGFLTLELQIPRGIRSVEGALDAFTQGEELYGDNQYKCDSCKQKRDAEQRTVIEIAPNVLMVALKRFSYYGFGKINSKVSFSEKLDLAPYMADDAADLEDLEYSLHAVIVHISPFSSAGHYIAFVRRGDQWFKCDDSSITAVSAKTVMSQNVYMLLYQRDVIKDHTIKGAERRTKRKSQDSSDTAAQSKNEQSAAVDEMSDLALSTNKQLSPSEEMAGDKEDEDANQSSSPLEAEASKPAERDAESTGENGNNVIGQENQKNKEENQDGMELKKPDYKTEEVVTAKGHKRLNLQISLPEVESVKEISLQFSQSRMILTVENKYHLQLDDLRLKTREPLKCRFVKKTKALKFSLHIE